MHRTYYTSIKIIFEKVERNYMDCDSFFISFEVNDKIKDE